MNSQDVTVAKATTMRNLNAVAFIIAFFASVQCTAQTLQAGISVNIPIVVNATPVPDADKGDALIVTVTENGDIYLGLDPITSDALADKLKHAVAFRPKKQIYLKADARAQYADVERVLIAASKAGVQTPVLLTSRREPVESGAVVPPTGFEVSVGSQADSESRPTLVQLLSSGPQSSTLNVNHMSVSWSDLPSVLARLTKAGSAAVQVSADGSLPFSDVARAIDIVRSAGATVALVMPKI